MILYELVAPEYEARSAYLDTPTLFVAGPIQGAPNWQSQVVDLTKHHWPYKSDLRIANPRRPVTGVKFNAAQKAEQIRWEKQHIRHASTYGAVIFYFAAQDPEEPYEEGRAYAQTSRIEIGRVFGWKDYDPDIQIAVGIEPEYEGGSVDYIRSLAEEHDLPVHNNLLSITLAALQPFSTTIR